MKKLLGLLSVALVAAFTTAIAQPPAGGGGGRNMDPAAMKERQKTQLKEAGIVLTDVQLDSMMAIRMDAMQKMRGGGFRDMAPEERQAKMKEGADAMSKRLAVALKDEALAKKVTEFYEKQRQQRMQGGGGGRQGGGFGGGGNN